MKWFIHTDGRQEGPLFLEDLKLRIAERKVNGETHVWKPGMPKWKKLQEVPELAEILAAPPELPTQSKPAPVRSASSVQVDELSVFTELPKAANEAPPEIPVAHAGQFKKEAIKAQFIARKTETLKSSKQILPRVAIGLAALCVLLVGLIAFLSLSKKDLSPITGVSDSDFARLRAAVVSPEANGTKVEIAASTDDPVHPRIHIASNLSNGTRFALTFRGVPGTLVKPMTQPANLETPPQRGYHTATDRFELPRGEYQVEVTVIGDPKVVASGTYFLGGVKDADYESTISQARAQKRQKAESELRSLNEAVTLLSSFQEFLLIFGTEANPTGHPNMQKVQETQKRWEEFEKTLSQRSIVWQTTPEGEFVLGRLVRLARETWNSSKQAHRLFGEYFSKANSPQTELMRMRDGIQSEIAKVQNAMIALKVELDKTHVQEL